MAAPPGFRDYERLFVGLDVGSTTVKAVVVDPTTDEILWQDYQRHDTKQPEKVLEFLTRIESDFPLPPDPVMKIRKRSAGSGKSDSIRVRSSSTFSGCLVSWR